MKKHATQAAIFLVLGMALVLLMENDFQHVSQLFDLLTRPEDLRRWFSP